MSQFYSPRARTTLQVAVIVLAFVPIIAGFTGVLLGPAMVGDGNAVPVDLDSHYRYLSGLLLAIGLGFWTTVPNIERKTRDFRLLTAIVFIGGLGRLVSLIIKGDPSAQMLFGLCMELVVTPLLCLWQAKLERVDQPTFNRNRLKVEKLIDSKVLELTLWKATKPTGYERLQLAVV